MIFLEPTTWRFEPLWGIWRYHGTLVVMAPLLAGLAAWDGARTSGLGQLAAVRGTSLRFILGYILVAAASLVAAYSVGLIVVLGVLVHAGGGASLSRVDNGIWISILPVVAYTFLAASLGAVFGAFIRRWFASPLIAAGIYGVEVALFHGGLASWVTVGGTTGSLVSLAPNPARYGAQTLFLLALSILVIAIYCQLVGRARHLSIGVLAAALAAAGSTLAFSAVHSPVFRDGHSEETCIVKDSVTYCAPTDYARRLDAVASAIGPFDTKLRGQEVPMASQYTAQWSAGSPSGQISTSLLLGGGDEVSLGMAAAITGATPGGCQEWGDEQYRAHAVLYQFLTSSSSGDAPDDLIDARIVSPDPAVVGQVLGEAIDILKKPCGP